MLQFSFLQGQLEALERKRADTLAISGHPVSGLLCCPLPRDGFRKFPSRVEVRLCLVGCRPMVSSAVQSHVHMCAHVHTHRERSVSSQCCLPAHNGTTASLALPSSCLFSCPFELLGDQELPREAFWVLVGEGGTGHRRINWRIP